MIPLGSHPAWHGVFETLGYSSGFLLYRRLRGTAGDQLTDAQRWNVIAASALGALLGARLLNILYELPRTAISWSQIFAPTGGKTIVGGLLGAWIAVELIKIMQGIRTRTGDLFAIPLCLGIAVGRIGCLLAGLGEDTYGNPTHLPWAVDFGDGIPRHPTQAYEIAFVGLLAVYLIHRQRSPYRNGLLFRIFMAAYLTFRFAIDFLKPEPLFQGLSMIQWSCAAGLILLGFGWPNTRQSMEPTHEG